MSARFRGWFGLALVVALPLACSSDDDERAPPASAGTRSGGSSGSASDGGAGDANGAAGTPELGGMPAGGAGGDSGIPPVDFGGSLSLAGAPNYGPALCDFEASWGNSTALAGVSTVDGDERLLSMTHDELTLVFTRDDVLMVADRAAVSADFGAGVALTLPANYTHLHGVALHPDGLGLVVVSDTGKMLADVKRAARSGSFDSAPDTSRFGQLIGNAVQTGAAFSSPVLSVSGESLYFTALGGGTSLVFNTHGTTSFPVAEPEDVVTLSGTEGELKLTVSISADERTLFYFDEALGHVAGLWSTVAGGPFGDLAEFPGLEDVFSNADCGRLYGTRLVSGSLDVVLETPN